MTEGKVTKKTDIVKHLYVSYDEIKGSRHPEGTCCLDIKGVYKNINLDSRHQYCEEVPFISKSNIHHKDIVGRDVYIPVLFFYEEQGALKILDPSKDIQTAFVGIFPTEDDFIVSLSTLISGHISNDVDKYLHKTKPANIYFIEELNKKIEKYKYDCGVNCSAYLDSNISLCGYELHKLKVKNRPVVFSIRKF